MSKLNLEHIERIEDMQDFNTGGEICLEYKYSRKVKMLWMLISTGRHMNIRKAKNVLKSKLCAAAVEGLNALPICVQALLMRGID